MTGFAPAMVSPATRTALQRAIDDGRMFRLRQYQADRIDATGRFLDAPEDDGSTRYFLDNWSRQTGKSASCALDSVLLAGQTGETVMHLSASLDQTKELMLKVAVAAEAVYGIVGELQREVMGGGLDEVFDVDQHGVKITQTVITLPGGERLVGRPANARTARGFSAHVKLDEFAMHQDQDEIWAAAYPSITSREHLTIAVMSTPGLRTDDKFADLCTTAERGESDFRYQKVTIFDAIRDGLYGGNLAKADELKRNLRDDDRWRREFLCEFVDEAGAFLTYELIRGCQHEGLRKDLPADPRQWDEQTLGWDPSAGELYVGMDIGRRHDLTVLWLGQLVGDVLWTRAIIELYRVPFAQQLQIVSQLFRGLPIRRACCDDTGVGMMFVEELQRIFGSSIVEAVTFTAKVKAELANPFKARFEDKLIRIPIDATLHEDLHSIRKVVTAAGNIRYAGERTEDGHADRFWAGALCNHACEEQGAIPRGFNL